MSIVSLASLREHSLDPYDGFIAVSEAKTLGIIPEVFHKFFDNFCDPEKEGCGSEMIISKSATQFGCCNTFCRLKAAYRLRDVFRLYGAKGIGDEGCKSVVFSVWDELENPSHLQVLRYPANKLPAEISGYLQNNFATAQYLVANSLVTFPSMVTQLAIPGIGKGVFNAFSPFSSVADLVPAITNSGGVSYFFNSRGVYDLRKMYNFMQYLPDIVDLEETFFRNIRKVGEMVVSICITGRLYNHTKDSFIEECNKVFRVNGRQLVEFKIDRAVSTTEYLIRDRPDYSDQYNTVFKREEATGKKLIYTSEEFLSMLEELRGSITGEGGGGSDEVS